MPLTPAEKQKRYRDRQRAKTTTVADLESRVATLEAELASLKAELVKVAALVSGATVPAPASIGAAVVNALVTSPEAPPAAATATAVLDAPIEKILDTPIEQDEFPNELHLEKLRDVSVQIEEMLAGEEVRGVNLALSRLKKMFGHLPSDQMLEEANNYVDGLGSGSIGEFEQYWEEAFYTLEKEHAKEKKRAAANLKRKLEKEEAARKKEEAAAVKKEERAAKKAASAKPKPAPEPVAEPTTQADATRYDTDDKWGMF
ncbi:hypothetical protein [Mongoliimonas terrestris]|uniref:hypothetical protein n=1 Tax=Mongoliimonas terrestris TaxID=1709001 RepID=UPI000AD3403D|nr:hypothetical protein [Mongoliimonas terrestris]